MKILMQKSRPVLLPWLILQGFSTAALAADADNQGTSDQQAVTFEDAAVTKDAAVTNQRDSAYPARRAYGLGYPYHERNRGAYRSRGYGYGRGRRGYGYGYPGYRGQGGTPYRQHRQYGNPPFYSAPPAVDDPAVQE